MKILLFSALLIGLAVQTFAQTDTISGNYRLRGVVKDQTGAVFAGLNLYVRKGDSSRTFSTDINGEFELGLQPGEYEITVNKLYSSSFKTFNKIQDGGLNPNDLVFVLDSSHIGCNDSGGKPFPRPISLPKPPYPPVARAVRASGEVIVTVKIGTDGKAAEAVADSGHPLLRKAAELAAKESRFESGENDPEREAKLTYVFMPYVFTPSEKEKLHLKRYSNPCRIEVYSDVDVINYSTY